MKKIFPEKTFLISSSHSSPDSECLNKYMAHTTFNKDRFFHFIFDHLLQAPIGPPSLPHFKSLWACILHLQPIILLVFMLVARSNRDVQSH